MMARLKTMQIIAAALLLGQATFTAVVVFLVNNAPAQEAGVPAAKDLPIVSFVALAVFASNVPLALIMGGAIAKTQVAAFAQETKTHNSDDTKQEDSLGLLTTAQTVMIITFSLLEGPGFLGCIAFLLEGQLWVLAVPGCSMALQLVKFPTELRVESWINEQLATLRQLRSQHSA
jgi:hypothetical protein